MEPKSAKADAADDGYDAGNNGYADDDGDDDSESYGVKKIGVMVMSVEMI